jgi:hypothetical protein
MKLIETKTLGTAAASIEFTSIPQTFTDLVILLSVRITNASVTAGHTMAINGSNVGFSYRSLSGNGSSATSYADNAKWLGETTADDSTADTFGNVSIYIPNYSGATNKTWSIDTVGENNATATRLEILAGLRTNTEAITTLTFESTPSYAVGSTFSLYGITSGSDGIVTTT